MDNVTQTVVIKVGGSLLSQPRFAERFTAWFEQLERTTKTTNFVLIAGGGAIVEGLRQIDKTNPMSIETSHWAAIALMETQAEVLEGYLTGWQTTADWQRLSQTNKENPKPTRWIFASQKFLQEVEPQLSGELLSIGWQTTSDSIAARLAVCIEADLILLKSALPPAELAISKTSSYDWLQLAAAGYIDAEFPRIIADFPQRQLNAQVATLSLATLPGAMLP